MADQSFIVQEDWLETPRLRVKVLTETPTEGLIWHEGYSDPYLVVNFRAQLQTFEVAAGASGYKGLVVPGDFSFLPPSTPFGGYYKGTYMCYACITFPTETLNSRFTDGKPIIMHSDPLIQAFAEALHAQRHRHDPDVALYRESITEALIQHLQLLHLNPLFPHERQLNFDRLNNYVRSHLNQKLTVAELATILSTTPQSLQRLVRKQFGQSVYEWVTTLRLERSLELLQRTNLNLATIAIETGFANQAHWTRLFSRKFGVTPGKVRQS